MIKRYNFCLKVKNCAQIRRVIDVFLYHKLSKQSKAKTAWCCLYYRIKTFCLQRPPFCVSVCVWSPPVGRWGPWSQNQTCLCTEIKPFPHLSTLCSASSGACTHPRSRWLLEDHKHFDGHKSLDWEQAPKNILLPFCEPVFSVVSGAISAYEKVKNQKLFLTRLCWFVW